MTISANQTSHKNTMPYPETGAMRYYGLVVSVLFLINLCVFWPGIFSLDSVHQFNGAINNYISNLHPPIMSWWWRWLMLNVMMDKGVLLLFHLLLFWPAIYLIGREVSKYSADWAYMLLLLWVSPPIISMTSVLWKDSAMAFCFLLSSAIMMRSTLYKKRLGLFSIVLVIALLFYGTAVRHNALFALPPLCYWFARCILGYKHKIISVISVAVIIMALLFASTSTFSKRITSDPVYAPQQLMIISLTFVTNMTSERLLPEYLWKDNNLTYEEFRAKMPGYYDYMNTFPYHTEDPEKLSKLKEAFFNMLLEHPFTYLKYRAKMLRLMLRFGEYPYYAYQWAGPPYATPVHWIGHYLHHHKSSFWFLPWIWFAGALTMIVFSIQRIRQKKRLGEELLLINLSGVMYVLLSAFVVPSTDFRYSYWMIIAFMCSFILWVSSVKHADIIDTFTKIKTIITRCRTWVIR